MDNFLSKLPDYLVLDGGFATELVRTHGFKDVDGDPLWSARLISTNPDAVKKVHLSFLESGSDAIETATYQATIGGFVDHLRVNEEEAFALIRKGAELACQVRDHFWEDCSDCHQERLHPLVVGSLGPYGVYLADGSEYSGCYINSMTQQVLSKWHQPRVAAVIAGGVDLIAFDTIPAGLEALALAHLLETEFPDAKAWISFSCKDGEHLSHGEKFNEVACSLLPYHQVIGIGINCTAPEYVEPLLRSLPEDVKKEKLLIVYPNSGEVWSNEKTWVKEKDVIPLAEYVPSWVAAGAKWIGGCCRVGPEDIRNIRAAMVNMHLIS